MYGKHTEVSNLDYFSNLKNKIFKLSIPPKNVPTNTFLSLMSRWTKPWLWRNRIPSTTSIATTILQEKEKKHWFFFMIKETTKYHKLWPFIFIIYLDNQSVWWFHRYNMTFDLLFWYLPWQPIQTLSDGSIDIT